MKPILCATVGIALSVFAASSAEPACCYFSAMDKDVKQPGQRAFLTWDPQEKVESFTVQPIFEGNAEDFGMVIPTPAVPKLSEMHRDFFKSLAVYTILKPMNQAKFKGWMTQPRGGVAYGAGGVPELASKSHGVKVLETGTVGSLDYKIIEATNPDGLYDWLKANKYNYSGDTSTLDHYISKKWFFTVMKIDSKQMKKNADGSYRGEITPTRFTFSSDKLVYPLRITKLSVKDKTDALFYISAPEKMDLPGELSYQIGYQSMWGTAFGWADWTLCTKYEAEWWAHVKDKQPEIAKDLQAWQAKHPGKSPSTLEWSRRLTDDDIRMLKGEIKFDREAPEEDVKKLATLSGVLRPGSFITKCRHIFTPGDMDDDLVFVEAAFKGKKDIVEHIEILPTSPP